VSCQFLNPFPAIEIAATKARSLPSQAENRLPEGGFVQLMGGETFY